MADYDSGQEVAVYHPSTDDDFGRTVVHPYENIERQEEKESGSVHIKPKRHLVIEFRLIKVSELILGSSRSFVTTNALKDWHADHIQRNQR